MWRHLYQVKRRPDINVIPSIPRGLRKFFAALLPTSLSFNSPPLPSLTPYLFLISFFLSLPSFFLIFPLLYQSLLDLPRRAQADGLLGAGGQAQPQGVREAGGSCVFL
jgi:hypothetical protein